MNPLKVKASTTPITSAVFSGLQPLTNAEVQNYIANVITTKFATDTTGSGTAEINITTDNSGLGTSIGTFSDTDRTEATGTHPATGSVDTVTYYAKQVTTAVAENVTARPVAWSDGVHQMSDSDLDDVSQRLLPNLHTLLVNINYKQLPRQAELGKQDTQLLMSRTAEIPQPTCGKKLRLPHLLVIFLRL
jgi:hypothetical protein